jgi:putative peptide zinc metalloprotease protein
MIPMVASFGLSAAPALAGAAIVWWAAAPDTLISLMALSAVLIGGVTTIVMNANPLIQLDGYFALSDYLEVQNLRQRAFAHLAWLVKTKLLRLEAPMPPADEREQRIFLIYALLAAWYIGSIMLLIAGTATGGSPPRVAAAFSSASGWANAVRTSFRPRERLAELARSRDPARDRLPAAQAGCRGAHP